jgi:hypothetical protein
MAKNNAGQKMDQISARVQQGLDSLFIPRGIMKNLAEIKQLQNQEKVCPTKFPTLLMTLPTLTRLTCYLYPAPSIISFRAIMSYPPQFSFVFTQLHQ